MFALTIDRASGGFSLSLLPLLAASLARPWIPTLLSNPCKITTTCPRTRRDIWARHLQKKIGCSDEWQMSGRWRKEGSTRTRLLLLFSLSSCLFGHPAPRLLMLLFAWGEERLLHTASCCLGVKGRGFCHTLQALGWAAVLTDDGSGLLLCAVRGFKSFLWPSFMRLLHLRSSHVGGRCAVEFYVLNWPSNARRGNCIIAVLIITFLINILLSSCQRNILRIFGFTSDTQWIIGINSSLV